MTCEPLAGIRWPQPPHPGKTKPHVPHQGDPGLRRLRLCFVLLVLPASHAFGFLLAILGRRAVSVVRGAQRLLVGLRARRRAAGSVEGDGNPVTDLPGRSPNPFQTDVKMRPHHDHQSVGPPDQGLHESLVRAQGDEAQQPALAQRRLERIRHVFRFGPTPAQGQPDQIDRPPLGIAMPDQTGNDSPRWATTTAATPSPARRWKGFR